MPPFLEIMARYVRDGGEKMGFATIIRNHDNGI